MRVFLQFADLPAASWLVRVLRTNSFDVACTLLDEENADEFMKVHPGVLVIREQGTPAERMIEELTRADGYVLHCENQAQTLRVLELLRAIQQNPHQKKQRRVVLFNGRPGDASCTLLKRRLENLTARRLVSGQVLEHGLIYDAKGGAFGALCNYIWRERVLPSAGELDVRLLVPMSSAVRLAMGAFRVLAGELCGGALLVEDGLWSLGELLQKVGEAFVHPRRSASAPVTPELRRGQKKGEPSVQAAAAPENLGSQFRPVCVDGGFLVAASELQGILEAVLGHGIAISQKTGEKKGFSKKEFEAFLNFQPVGDAALDALFEIVSREQLEAVPRVFSDVGAVFCVFVLGQLGFRDVFLQGSGVLNQLPQKVETLRESGFVIYSYPEALRFIGVLGEPTKSPEFWTQFCREPEMMAAACRALWNKGLSQGIPPDQALWEYIDTAFGVSTQPAVTLEPTKKRPGSSQLQPLPAQPAQPLNGQPKQTDPVQIALQAALLALRDTRFSHTEAAFVGFSLDGDTAVLESLQTEALDAFLERHRETLAAYLDPKRQAASNVQKGQLTLGQFFSQQGAPQTQSPVANIAYTIIPNYPMRDASLNPIIAEVLRNGEKSALTRHPAVLRLYTLLADYVRWIARKPVLSVALDEDFVSLRPALYARVPRLADVSAFFARPQTLLAAHRLQGNATRCPPLESKKPQQPQSQQQQMIDAVEAQLATPRATGRAQLRYFTKQLQANYALQEPRQAEKLLHLFGEPAEAPQRKLFTVQTAVAAASAGNFKLFMERFGGAALQEPKQRPPSAPVGATAAERKTTKQTEEKAKPSGLQEAVESQRVKMEMELDTDSGSGKGRLHYATILAQMQEKLHALLEEKDPFLTQLALQEEEAERQRILAEQQAAIEAQEDKKRARSRGKGALAATVAIVANKVPAKPASNSAQQRKPKPEQGFRQTDEPVEKSRELYRDLDDVRAYLEESGLPRVLEDAFANLAYAIKGGLVEDQLRFLGDEILRLSAQ